MSNRKKIIIIIAAVVAIAIIGIVVINVLKCDYPGCDSFRMANSRYCYAHTCREDGCYNQKYTRDNRCPVHKYESELDTFDVVTGAELIRREDKSNKKYTYVDYYYTGGETESECRELIHEYQDYLASNTDWEWIDRDKPENDYYIYNIDVTQSFDISIEQEEGAFFVEVQITG